jgi:hypothetical protein
LPPLRRWRRALATPCTRTPTPATRGKRARRCPAR